MCGIAGIMQFDGAPVSRDVLAAMSGALRHRGPDAHGMVLRSASAHSPASVGLANQRLSIIDVAGGHQPVSNEDGTIWTVLNGEIYNFVTLRDELERRHHRFATRSDTEVIVHAYEEWGEACVEHFDGMFAFAVWDERAGQLLLARDRFGKKPLVYFNDGSRLVFASELQALQCVPGLPRDLDLEALGTYLAYMAIPAPQTIYQGVKKLPPAQTLVCTSARVRLREYWTLNFMPKRAVSEPEAVDRVAVLFDAAVRKRLVGEVPLGAFLSGGVDSTAVVSAMAAMSGRPVKTFSIGFDVADYNELPHAREVAQLFGCAHHEFVVKASAVEVLPDVVRHFGEPYADSSAIPTWYLSKLTREHVTVALNGDGGDELFAGYGRHLANRLAEQWQRMPAPLRQSAERVASLGLFADVGGARAARFAAASRLTRAERYRAWAGVFSADLVGELSTAAADDRAATSAFARAEPLDAVDAMLAVDTGFYLPTDLLPKVDISSMAHSLEVRSPLLDVPLAEFVASLPSNMKLRRFTTKYLLKQVVARRVPMTLLRRRKRGFAVPLKHWFRGELKGYLRDHLQPSQVARAGVLRQVGIDRLIDDHVAGRTDHSHHLWVLLMLELWYRAFHTA